VVRRALREDRLRGALGKLEEEKRRRGEEETDQVANRRPFAAGAVLRPKRERRKGRGERRRF
jgi:hypothetical protein